MRHEFGTTFWVSADGWTGLFFSSFMWISMMLYGFFSWPSIFGGFFSFVGVMSYGASRHLAGRIWAYRDVQGIMRGEEPKMSQKKPVLENPPPGDDWIADD